MNERRQRLIELKGLYRKQLLDDCLPFWMAHLRDREFGGYHTCLDRDGSVYEHDKLCMWCPGRIIWMFSFLYNELEQRAEWLDMARWGVDFVQEHGFAPDGSMPYSLTRDGRPLEPPRDVFVELFTASGFSEFARAASDEELHRQARQLFFRTWEKITTPGAPFPPFVHATRPVHVHGHSLIALNVAQELRRYREDPRYEQVIDRCLDDVLRLHARPRARTVLEAVSWDGQDLPGSLGRCINPGHMMEAGIFIVHEGRRRGDEGLVQWGVNFIDWGFEWGWDKQFGGIYNDVDADGVPVPQTREAFIYQSKLWWQHAEALYALLVAYEVTGESKFMDGYELTHDYAFGNFADPEHGEWFALLDRRGNRLNDTKGTPRKSPFHVPRNFYYCYRLLERMTAGAAGQDG